MRTKIFIFAMLASVAASAQSTVQITPISATYTTTPIIQFKVSWTYQTTANHRNKVWIFVDFQTVISPTEKGNWQPATITGTVQKTAGTVSEQSNRGFFLEGTTTNFSSTVTLQLSNTNVPFNWCAYGSDYPPNVTANNGTYTLHGTPPFTLIAANGTTTQTVNESTIATSAVTITPVTLTDKTGCPGIFCNYTGSDLYIDATHLCQQRTSGANNWEAYIKDSRDDKIYRIVQIETTWWFAEDFLLTGSSGTQTCSGVTLYRLSPSVNCPSGWDLPTWSKWQTRLGLDAGFPETSIFGDEQCPHMFAYGTTCYVNTNFHVLAKDHTTGHCWFPGQLARNCNNGQMGSSRCIREL
jgi:hypothetical protein